MGGMRDGETLVPFRDLIAKSLRRYERMELLKHLESSEDLKGMASLDSAATIRRESALSLDKSFLDFDPLNSFDFGIDYLPNLEEAGRDL